MLTKKTSTKLATVRRKACDFGIEPKDIDRAIKWARGRGGELKDRKLLQKIARARGEYAKGKSVPAERLFKKMDL